MNPTRKKHDREARDFIARSGINTDRCKWIHCETCGVIVGAEGPSRKSGVEGVCCLFVDHRVFHCLRFMRANLREASDALDASKREVDNLRARLSERSDELERVATRAHKLSQEVAGYQYGAAVVVELATGDDVALAGPRALLAAAKLLQALKTCDAAGSFGPKCQRARDAVGAALAADRAKGLL